MTISDREQEGRLYSRLASIPAIAARGLAIERGDADGVVIAAREHVRGVWTVRQGVFLYTPAAYSVATRRAISLEQAATIMLSMI